MPSAKKLPFVLLCAFFALVLVSIVFNRDPNVDLGRCYAQNGGSGAASAGGDGTGGTTTKDPWGPDTMHSVADWATHFGFALGGDIAGSNVNEGDFWTIVSSISGNSNGLASWEGISLSNATLTIPLPGPADTTKDPHATTDADMAGKLLAAANEAKKYAIGSNLSDTQKQNLETLSKKMSDAAVDYGMKAGVTITVTNSTSIQTEEPTVESPKVEAHNAVPIDSNQGNTPNDANTPNQGNVLNLDSQAASSAIFFPYTPTDAQADTGINGGVKITSLNDQASLNSVQTKTVTTPVNPKEALNTDQNTLVRINDLNGTPAKTAYVGSSVAKEEAQQQQQQASQQASYVQVSTSTTPQSGNEKNSVNVDNRAGVAADKLTPLVVGDQGAKQTSQVADPKNPSLILLVYQAPRQTEQIGSQTPAVTTVSPHYSASNPEVSVNTANPGNNANTGNNNNNSNSNQYSFNWGDTGGGTNTVVSQPAGNAASAPAVPAGQTAQSGQTVQTAQTASTPSGNAGTNAVPDNTAGTDTVTADSNPIQSPVDSQAQVNVVKNGSQYTTTLKTDQASHVDFYIYGQSLSALMFLGTGTFDSGGGSWEFSFDSNLFPNGGYEIFALISKKGGSFQSPRSGFSIDNAVAVNTRQQSDRKDQLVQAQQTVTVATQAIQPSFASKTISAALPQNIANSPAFQGDISDFTAAVGNIKQLNNSLSQTEAENSKIVDQIAQLEKKLAALSPKTLDSLRNDMVAQLNELVKQKLLLDASIVGTQQQIKDAQDKQARAKAAILGLVGPAQQASVQSQLTSLEQSVGTSAQQAIDAQNELNKDSDNDGLSDYDELFVYHTDPFNPDTDGDGFLDGDEVAHGFDPLDPNDHKAVVYKDPRTVPPLKADVYTVDSVSSVQGSSGQTGIKLAGHGLANSYVDLFIYSQPLVVEVKTDSQGRWEYVLGKPLNDGLHTVYAAQVNSVGEIEARSQEFVFLKAGANASPVTEDLSMPQSTVQQLQGNFGFYALCITLIGVGVAFLIMGLAARAVKKETPEIPVPAPRATLK